MSRAGATLTTTKRGPVGNPNLCAQGCAVLAFTIPAGTGWGDGAIVDEWFASSTNLHGATVRATVALEVPRSQSPVNVRVFTQGDVASEYSWGTTASLSTTTLADVSSFHEIVLHPTDRSAKSAKLPYCASATGAVGIQIQRSRSSNVDIPVKLYIQSVSVNEGAGSAVQSMPSVEALGPGDWFERPPSTPNVGGTEGFCQLADDGALSVAADDWVAAGTCQSYGYTVVAGDRLDTKVVPTCNASRCTPRLSKVSSTALCASGTIAMDPTWKSKVGLGFDLDPERSGKSGLSLSYQMAGTAILRFLLQDTEGTIYCADLDETDENASTVNLPWESLTTHCWDPWNPGTPYHPSQPIKGVQLSASCLATKNSWFDMCVTGLGAIE